MTPTPNMHVADRTASASADIEAGSEIVMTFQIPDIEDPLYGKASGLQGEFPLFTPYGYVLRF
jgi:hypothetical protein